MDAVNVSDEKAGHSALGAHILSAQSPQVDWEGQIEPSTPKINCSTINELEHLDDSHKDRADPLTQVLVPQSQQESFGGCDGETDFLCHSEHIAHDMLFTDQPGTEMMEQLDGTTEDLNEKTGNAEEAVTNRYEPDLGESHESEAEENLPDTDPLHLSPTFAPWTQTETDTLRENHEECCVKSETVSPTPSCSEGQSQSPLLEAPSDSACRQDNVEPKEEPMDEEEMQHKTKHTGDAILADMEEYVIPGMLGDNTFIGSDLNMPPCVSQEEVIANCIDNEGLCVDSQVPMLVSGTFNNFKDAEVTVEINEEEVDIMRAGSPVVKLEDSSDDSNSLSNYGYPTQPLQQTMFHAMAPLPQNSDENSMPFNSQANSNGGQMRGIKREFPYERSMQGPVRTKAARKITPPSPVKKELNHESPSGTLSNKSLQENLRKQELDETFFTCDFCFKLFRRRNALMAHIKLHEALNIGNHNAHIYECKECKKTYSSRYNLNHHTKRCHSDREFKCEHCSEVYSTNADLSRHSRTHRSVKSYKCNRCGKVFQKRKTFSAHIKVHPQVVHECVTCFQKFSWENDLIEHNKTHEVPDNPVASPGLVVAVPKASPSPKVASNNNQQGKPFNKLKLDYCYSYINLVKNEFTSEPQVYEDFLNTIKQFKFKGIDIGQFLERISVLFKDHSNLIDGFNTFLPQECKVDIPLSPNREPPADRNPHLDEKFNPRGELDDSLAYLSQVKQRFHDKPNIYTTFTYIIKEYKLNSLQIPEVAARVTALFKDHPDLILGFNTFLPPSNRISLPHHLSQPELSDDASTPTLKPTIQTHPLMHRGRSNFLDNSRPKSLETVQEPSPYQTSCAATESHLPLTSSFSSGLEVKSNSHGNSNMKAVDTASCMSSSINHALSQSLGEKGSRHSVEMNDELGITVDVSQKCLLVSKSNVSHNLLAANGNGHLFTNSCNVMANSLAVSGSSSVSDDKTHKNVTAEVENVDSALTQKSRALLRDHPQVMIGVNTSAGTIVVSAESGCRNLTTPSDLRLERCTVQGLAKGVPILLQSPTGKVPQANTVHDFNLTPDANMARKVAFEIGKRLGTSGKKILIISANVNPTVCETAPTSMVPGLRVSLPVSPSHRCTPTVTDNILNSSTCSPQDSLVSVEIPSNALSTNSVKKAVPSIVSNANIGPTIPLVGSKTHAVQVCGVDEDETSKNSYVENSVGKPFSNNVVCTDKIKSPGTGDASPLKAIKGSSRSSLLYKQLMSKGNNKRITNSCNIQSLATFTKIEVPSHNGSCEKDTDTNLSESKTICGNISQADLGLLAKINTLPSVQSSLSFSGGSKISIPYVVNSANSNVIFSIANSVSDETANMLSVPDNISNPKFVPASVNNGPMVHSNGRAIYTVANNNMLSANPTKIALIGNNALKIAASTNSYTGLNIVRSTNIAPCTYTFANTSSIASFPAAASPVNPGNRPMILIRTNPISGAYLLSNPGARLSLGGKKASPDYPVPAKETSSVTTNGSLVTSESTASSCINAQPVDSYTKRIGVWKNKKMNRTKRTIGPKMATMKTYISNKTISICKPSAIENATAAPLIMNSIRTSSCPDVGNTTGMTENVSGTTRYSTNKSPKRRKICPNVKTLSTVTNICVKTQDRVVNKGSQRNRLLLPAGNTPQTPLVVSCVPSLVAPLVKQTMSETSRYFANFSTDQPSSQAPIKNVHFVSQHGNNIKQTSEKMQTFQPSLQNNTQHLASRPVKTKAARKQCLDIKTDPVNKMSTILEEQSGDDNKTLLKCETCPKTYSRKDSLAKHMAKTHLPNKPTF